MKILLVEDEIKTASYLQRGLRENGFVVDVAYDGEDGLHLAQERIYDLIIVDVMLPHRDGWSLISELRRSGNQTLALFLTARDALSDRIKGLELGADAYLVKPFAFSELLANIRTLLRRGPARQPETLQIHDLKIDLIHSRVFRAGRRIDLTPKEFQLLVLLARRKGETLSRTVIADQVWDMNFDSDTNVVDVHIRRLRSKVELPDQKKLIHTVRGMGYVLEEEL
ncbi:MAG: heavy metal response regulator transcription factor [Deltaproteobacteria bacterium]|nr:heavy metal response regulator transcription factor [Deltaproteobacteria bacterium]